MWQLASTFGYLDLGLSIAYGDIMSWILLIDANIVVFGFNLDNRPGWEDDDPGRHTYHADRDFAVFTIHEITTKDTQLRDGDYPHDKLVLSDTKSCFTTPP